MKRLNTIILPLLVLLFVSSCSNETKQVEEVITEQPVVEEKITDSTIFENSITSYDAKPGFLGVFNVPEMLVLSIIDSADAKSMSKAMVKNYAILEEEMIAIGAEMNGPIGMLTYNNDVNNFLFENVLCIKRIPKIQPKKCKIVILESSQILIYNFYGSYQSLFAAYDKIKKYNEKNDLIQIGPMREFYLTDPAKEKDQSKWLTRIMIPVISMHSKPKS
jgi:effector-binding domain-containing protein